MATTTYWADKYVENRRSARNALNLIKPGQRVFIGSSCGEPQHLVRELSEMSNYLKDIEINRLMTLETTPLTLIAEAVFARTLSAFKDEREALAQRLGVHDPAVEQDRAGLHLLALASVLPQKARQVPRDARVGGIGQAQLLQAHAPLGARAAHALPRTLLRRVFAGFLAIMGLNLLWRAFG